MANGESSAIAVEVVFSPAAHQVLRIPLSLPPGATVAEAIERSGLSMRCAGFDLQALKLGIWGKACAATDALRDRDRVEIYRPLKVDPKDARRLRAQRQPTKKKPGR